MRNDRSPGLPKIIYLPLAQHMNIQWTNSATAMYRFAVRWEPSKYPSVVAAYFEIVARKLPAGGTPNLGLRKRIAGTPSVVATIQPGTATLDNVAMIKRSSNILSSLGMVDGTLCLDRTVASGTMEVYRASVVVEVAP